MARLIQIALVSIYLLIEIPYSFAVPSFQQIVDEGGGISGYLSGIITIIFLYILGYPILFIINYIRLAKSRIIFSIKKDLIPITNKCVNNFMMMGVCIAFFIIPISTIPFFILYAIISLALDILFNIPYGVRFELVVYGFFILSLLMGFIYSIYYAVKETKL